MAEDTLLNELFPDPVVRAAVVRTDRNFRDGSCRYDTTFSLHKEDGTQLYKAAGAACFGRLGSSYHYVRANNKVAPNEGIFLHYTPNYYGAIELKREVRVRWVEIGQTLGIFPRYREASDIVDNGVRINLDDPKLTVAQLYMTLGFFRWLREAPRVVEGAIDLIDNAGRDPWAAIVFCHWHNVYHTDHSLLPFTGTNIYGANAWVGRDIALVLRMYQLTKDPATIDNRIFCEAVKGNGTEGSHFWEWHTRATKPEKNFILKDRKMLLSSEVYPVFSAPDIEEAHKRIQRLQETSKHVKFEK